MRKYFYENVFEDDEDDIKINYQDPDDFDNEKEVFHDEDECCKSEKSDFHDEDDDDKIKVVIKGLDDGDKIKFKLKKSDDEDDDEEDEESSEDYSEKENDTMNGRDFLRSIHQEPENLPIAYAENADRYYIDFNDLKAYMEAADIDSVEEALNNVIEAHTEDICADNVIVVLPENYDATLSESYIEYLQESAVNFEA